MSVVRWDPFKDLMTLQERMNRLFEETVQRGMDEPMSQGAWTPAVDIYETAGELVLLAELPGMELSDIDIQVRDNTLTIKGDRTMEKSVKEDTYHRVERAYGAFSRSFTMPRAVEQDRISASYKKGILEVRMPKPPEARPQQIKIKIKG